MPALYDFHEYDKNLSLKPSGGMWLVVVYLMRPYLMFLVIRQLQAVGGKPLLDKLRLLLYPDDFTLALGVITTIPVIVFMVVWYRRKPDASDTIRMLWKYGAWLLAASAVLNMIAVFVPLLTGEHPAVHTSGWIQLGVAVFIIAYLFGTRRVRDTFADFPASRQA